MSLMREMNQKEMHVWVVVFSFVILLTQHHLQTQAATEGFIKARGLNFVLNGNKFLANGFNAYWLMMLGSNPSQRGKVTSAFREAAGHGLSVGRTWAFSDGGANPLQYSPGSCYPSSTKVRGSSATLQDDRECFMKASYSAGREGKQECRQQFGC